MKSMRVLLADDHAMFRAGIRALLEGLEGVKIVGEAGDGLTALRLIQKLCPDLVLMDIQMPGMNGLSTLEQVSQELPDVRIIVLTMHANEEYVLQALRAGAAGYLLKGAGPSELETAIATVARGEQYLSASLSRTVLEQYARRTGSELTPLERLSPRQRQTLQLIAEGMNVKEIAQTLGISAKTVETHRSQLMAVLGIHDVPGLVRFAIRTGLVSPEQH